jgi:acyl-coenzyme A synthetase/AMP-(fatty) acid ligase/acyl carrier protein
VLRLFASTAHWLRYTRRDVWSLCHSFAFDFSVWEMWGALLHGGKIVLVPKAVASNPEEFHRLLIAERVTILSQTPSAFWELDRVDARSGAKLGSTLRQIIFAGEALPSTNLRKWLDRYGDEPELINMYGATETTVHATYRRIRPEDLTLPSPNVVGVPFLDMQVYLLDSTLEPVSAGAVGEFYVAGPGLLRGYWRRPRLTAERFVPHPHGEGERLYKTGDLGRWRLDGNVEFIGRIDHQVKVRGYRVELGEIEAALSDYPGVDQAVVIAREVEGDRQLTAYVLPGGGAELEAAALRVHLAARLPEYMVPSFLMIVAGLPLTANGKLDRRALPAPDERAGLGVRYVGPRTATEDAVAQIWAELMQLERVGVQDNFFDLGGHSLMAARVMTRVCEDFAVELPLRSLFEGPTVEALADRIEQARKESNAREETRWEEMTRRLRKEVEGMSEEDVQRILDQKRRDPSLIERAPSEVAG